ncbi:S26 family signal peptidase [Campylobacter helveticus]|uniref:S26 family signal peptidase n=1 Tax=Campylobacter helveticus TaxID=28898 RepID=A0AAX2UMQ4_9BACT|nr:S26 family signal peptidase [Campylobacter helveticus]ARE80660.1 conjugative transfer signal peptidase [Campylobacter helveticus]MCR2039244.1 S26 family signal peptidase [Campylobacter helveticus]MCR2059789.1 S26 family signal peptidase [Campylobacter helveticus]MCR2061716.1 S26 family signal peptidase [Campylobacter helveticus]MCR2065778.1 S26 family signal peptidase [Campylobacter helveticus]
MNFLQKIKEKYKARDKRAIQKLCDKTLIAIVVFLAFYTIISFVSHFYGVGVIHTKSIDKDVFVYKKKIDENLNDTLIYFTLPVQTRYFDKGSSFGKYVKCQGGQTLKTKHLSYYCDGVFLGKAKNTDIKGKSVENFIFNGTIPYNQFFVMGTHERSFDSRYWGFVNKKDIKGVAIWAI